MTTRLYHQDQYLSEFRSEVQASTKSPDGRGWGVVLRETAFYPEGGGQPWDYGTLDGQTVIRVENDGNRIVHTVAKDIPIGKLVVGKVDKQRRIDLMQQHTGQHLLSACIVEVADLRTVAFHLGEEVCTIDLHAEFPSAAAIARTEDLANRYIQEARPITATFPSKAELKNLPLRKEIAVEEEEIRVVIIQGLDYSGCCGTHVGSTGELGLLKIIKTERVKGGLCRVHFLVGQRALRDYQRKHEVLGELGRSFSASVETLSGAVEKLRQDERDLRRELKELRQKLYPYQAAELLASAPGTASGVKVIVQHLPEADRTDLTGLSAALTSQAAVACLLLAGRDNVSAVLRVSPGLGALHAGEMLKALLEPLGFKGGGNQETAQGGGQMSAKVLAGLLADGAELLTRRAETATSEPTPAG